MKKFDTEQFLQANPEWRPYIDLVVVPPDGAEVVAEFPDAEGSDVVRDEWGCIQPHVTRLAFYTRLRREGQTHRWAEMCALQSAPRGMTDDVFFAGMQRPGDTLEPRMLKTLLKQAKREGFAPSPGATYYPALAEYQGDPKAWVSRADGRGYIKKLCESRGWSCEGGVTVKGRQPLSDPHKDCVPLADDIIASTMREQIAADPSLKKKSRRELREKIIAEHGPTK